MNGQRMYRVSMVNIDPHTWPQLSVSLRQLTSESLITPSKQGGVQAYISQQFVPQFAEVVKQYQLYGQIYAITSLEGMPDIRAYNPTSIDAIAKLVTLAPVRRTALCFTFDREKVSAIETDVYEQDMVALTAFEMASGDSEPCQVTLREDGKVQLEYAFVSEGTRREDVRKVVLLDTLNREVTAAGYSVTMKVQAFKRRKKKMRKIKRKQASLQIVLDSDLVTIQFPGRRNPRYVAVRFSSLQKAVSILQLLRSLKSQDAGSKFTLNTDLPIITVSFYSGGWIMKREEKSDLNLPDWLGTGGKEDHFYSPSRIRGASGDGAWKAISSMKEATVFPNTAYAFHAARRFMKTHQVQVIGPRGQLFNHIGHDLIDVTDEVIGRNPITSGWLLPGPEGYF